MKFKFCRTSHILLLLLIIAVLSIALLTACTENPKTSQLDLSNSVLTRGQKLISWKEQLKPEWTFVGDLPYEFLVGGTNDTLLLLGDDGGLSGLHDDAYLYGVDRKTGERRWAVYGGYLPIYFYIGSSENSIAVSTNVANRIPQVKKLDLESGKVLWEKKMEDWEGYYEVKVAGAKNTTIVNLNKYVDQQLNGKLLALDYDNGDVLWEKELEPEERLLNTQRPLECGFKIW